MYGQVTTLSSFSARSSHTADRFVTIPNDFPRSLLALCFVSVALAK